MVIFRLFGAPTVYRLKPKFAWRVMTSPSCAEFQGEIFRGYDFTGGGSNFYFLIDFSCLTTVIGLHFPKFSDLY